MTDSNLNIFVSWSKEQAATIAPALKTFLEDVLGRANVFLSHEIDSGRRWSKEIAEALESCNAGVLVVTAENKFAPWLHFEAGAISKNIDAANVIPLLWDLPVGDIRETPLSQFQSKTFSKVDLIQVSRTLGNLVGLEESAVLRRFEANWATFEQTLAGVGTPKRVIDRAPTIEDVVALLETMTGRIEAVDQGVRALRPQAATEMFGSRRNALLEPTSVNALAALGVVPDPAASATKLELTKAVEEYLRQSRQKFEEGNKARTSAGTTTKK
jgi:hypothetical protein